MPEPLKDMFFTRDSVNHLAESIKQVYTEFDTSRFLGLIYDADWEGKALKERMRHTTLCLGKTLPESFGEALEILKKVIPHIKGFEVMTFPDYVEVFGLDDWKSSLPALAFFTRFGSAEFAVRPFLDRDPSRMIAFLERLAEDPDPSVRRLASEGCRPRLPWAMALPGFKKDPSLILPILEKLRDDESETVRRSVANNLNDISKDNPETTLDLCERWLGESESVDRVVKHACRSLLKAGDKRAMKLFGFGDPGNLRITGLEVEKAEIPIGGTLFFNFILDVAGSKRCKIRLEYAVHYRKAKGNLSRKVFQHSEKEYEPGEYPVRKKHSMANMSTRKHYAGGHLVSVIVNGEEKARCAFVLTDGHDSQKVDK